jgi:hypothetical protein
MTITAMISTGTPIAKIRSRQSTELAISGILYSPCNPPSPRRMASCLGAHLAVPVPLLLDILPAPRILHYNIILQILHPEFWHRSSIPAMLS